MFVWRLSSYINPAEGVFLLSKLSITQSYFKITHAVHLRPIYIGALDSCHCCTYVCIAFCFFTRYSSFKNIQPSMALYILFFSLQILKRAGKEFEGTFCNGFEGCFVQHVGMRESPRIENGQTVMSSRKIIINIWGLPRHAQASFHWTVDEVKGLCRQEKSGKTPKTSWNREELCSVQYIL